jgi:hypothetical protein
MAAYDELLEGSGQDKFLQLYQKYDATMVALKTGLSGQVLSGNGAGTAPSFQYPLLSFAQVEIGDWNMDSSSNVNVLHGIADFKKIRHISGVIRNDGDNVYYPMFSAAISGAATPLIGVIGISSTQIQLTRTDSSFFDSTSFDSTSYNRGYLIIGYIQ